MKKIWIFVLAAAMVFGGCAFALNYTAMLGNESSFETMTEARINTQTYVTDFAGAFDVRCLLRDR